MYILSARSFVELQQIRKQKDAGRRQTRKTLNETIMSEMTIQPYPRLETNYSVDKFAVC